MSFFLFSSPYKQEVQTGVILFTKKEEVNLTYKYVKINIQARQEKLRPAMSAEQYVWGKSPQQRKIVLENVWFSTMVLRKYRTAK